MRLNPRPATLDQRLQSASVAECVSCLQQLGEHVRRRDLVRRFLDLSVRRLHRDRDVRNRARVAAPRQSKRRFVRDALVVVAQTLSERGANARRVVIGETADRERRAIAHGSIRVLHQREQHALRALVRDQIFERRRHSPSHVARVVRRNARERIDRSRILPLPQRVHDSLDDRGLAVIGHRQKNLHRLIGERIQLSEDVGAGNALRCARAAAQLHRPIEDFARAEGVQLLDGAPARVIVLLSNDDREQFVDGMHAPMLPYVALMRSTLIVVVLLLLTACGELKTPTSPGDGGGDPIDPTATFTRVQNEIFTPTCGVIGCHDPLGKDSSANMILTAGRAYAQIVNQPSTETPSLSRIKPDDVANSYLYRKITGQGITGERMPLGGPYLNDAQIQLVKNWIRRGAPND